MKESIKTQVGGSHYNTMAIQPIEFISANDLPFMAGNIVKYICRYKNKNGDEDIKKIIQYAKMILEFEYNYTPEQLESI